VSWSPWQRKRRKAGGWGGGGTETDGGRQPTWSHTITNITEVVKGGVIRYAKQAWDDVSRVGFWLGVPSDGVPRFHVGGTDKYLLWDGDDLEIVGGALYLPTVSIDAGGLCIHEGSDVTNQLRFVDDDGVAVGSLQGLGGGSCVLTFATSQPVAAGDVGRIDFLIDGDIGASVGFRLETTKGSGASSAHFQVYIGNQLKFEIGSTGLLVAKGGVDANSKKLVNVADAAADTDALNRRTADGRYLAKSAGWTGTFATGDGRTVTVTNGQIVAVA
jgi:hypothetical protein